MPFLNISEMCCETARAEESIHIAHFRDRVNFPGVDKRGALRPGEAGGGRVAPPRLGPGRLVRAVTGGEGDHEQVSFLLGSATKGFLTAGVL